MRSAHILISSLHGRFDTRLVIVANFVIGLLVGTLLGLAIAPVLRAWLTWKTVEEARHAFREPRKTFPTRVDS
jgi:hypothetical protein